MPSIAFSNELRGFIDSQKWTYAKTMPTWPHEYIVRERVDETLFIKLVQYIRTNGYNGKFYQKDIIYFKDRGMVYWTMGAPIDETTIINRCKQENSYEYRKQNGILPER
jgi:hypothetical protein